MGDIYNHPVKRKKFILRKTNDFNGIGIGPFFERTFPIRLTGEKDGRWKIEDGSNCPAPFGEEERR